MKYELLKDLPDLKAGAIFEWDEKHEEHTCRVDNKEWYFSEDVMLDKEWFKEVPEPIICGMDELFQMLFPGVTFVDCTPTTFKGIWNLHGEKERIYDIGGKKYYKAPPQKTVCNGCAFNKFPCSHPNKGSKTTIQGSCDCESTIWKEVVEEKPLWKITKEQYEKSGLIKELETPFNVGFRLGYTYAKSH